MDGYGTDKVQAGDRGLFSTDAYRAILSFDTSALAGKQIVSATLHIVRKSLSGTVQGLTVDIKQGYFGFSAGIEQSDYNAQASQSGVASLAVPSSDGAGSSVLLPGEALQFIDASSERVQFRLKAETTASFTANDLLLDAGNTASGSLDATLVIQLQD